MVLLAIIYSHNKFCIFQDAIAPGSAQFFYRKGKKVKDEYYVIMLYSNTMQKCA